MGYVCVCVVFVTLKRWCKFKSSCTRMKAVRVLKLKKLHSSAFCPFLRFSAWGFFVGPVLRAGGLAGARLLLDAPPKWLCAAVPQQRRLVAEGRAQRRVRSPGFRGACAARGSAAPPRAAGTST